MASYKRTYSFLAGAVVGARLMYMLDPDSGTRRRQNVRDKAGHLLRVCADAGEKFIRDLGNRTRGAFSKTVSAITAEQVSDEVLAERVRTKLGRIVSCPSSIDVVATHGKITISGSIPDREMGGLIPRLYSVRGVKSIENRLTVQKSALETSSFRSPLPEWRQQRWSPTARVFAGSAAIMALRLGYKQGLKGLPLAVAGGSVLLRVMANRPLRGALGLTEDRHGIELEKTIEIHAPVEKVYRLWSNPESFSKLMSHVKEVRKMADGVYHWTVSGPAGVSISWDAMMTECVTNKILAWESIPGAKMQNAGIVRFSPTISGGTRVHLRISYNPMGGVVTHTLASLFGVDPKRVLDEDLLRLKSFCEEGKTTVHGKTISDQEIPV